MRLRTFYSWLPALAVATLVTLLAAPLPAQDRGPNRKVHVILAGLTSEKGIRQSVEYNLNQFQTLFEIGLADEHLGSLRIVKDAEVTARGLLDAVARCPVGSTDALFVYFHCHGGYDPRYAGGDPSQGHNFGTPGGDLLRKDLWKQMRARNARLTVLVTESCYVKGYASPYPATPRLPRATRDNPVMASLLLKHTGYVDINACSKDEYSWNFGSGRGGSFFSDSFVDMFHDMPFSDPAKVSWPTFIKAVSAKTNNIYHATRTNILKDADRLNPKLVNQVRNQLDQRPSVLQMSVFRVDGSTPEPRPGPDTIALGEWLRGRLTNTDGTDVIRTDSHRKVYPVRLEAGRSYVIDMQSSDLDPYLRLESSIGDNLAEDDDGGDGLNARLTFRPTKTDTYFVIATTYRRATGDFNLRVQAEGGAPTDVLRVGPGGLRLNVRVTPDDPRDRLRTESHAKVIPVHMEGGRTYIIELDSDTIDPFLRVENAGGFHIALDDDSGGGLNARLEFWPLFTGTYRIIATTYRPAAGDMVLRIREK